MHEIQLTWAAWHGDHPLSIRFPSSWDVKVIGGNRFPALSPDAVNDKICHPMGSPGLSELAKGNKSAAILMDDITRPTPANLILPFIVKELKTGGIRLSDITVIIAGGAHRETTTDHIIKKMGTEFVNELNIQIHDSENNLTFMGTTEKGTPIYVNRTYLESDLKIGIGTILPHPIAGFSGGSKIVVPGVCGGETIRYLHDYTQCYQHDYHGGPGKRVGWAQNVFRREIDAVCDIVGLDFLVNVVLNPKREILELFAGDWKTVYMRGAGMVSECYKVAPVRADVIVANTYPFDTDMRYMLRGFWPLSTGNPKATKVVIGFGAGGLGVFGSKNTAGSLPPRLRKRLKKFRPRHILNEFKIGANILRKMIRKRDLEYLIFSPGIKDEDLVKSLPKSMCFDRWENVLAEITRRNPQKNLTVAIYPYAPLQFS